MSDLQCPTTIYLTRHGETEYETHLLMNAGGSLTLRGREQARELGRRLAGERVAAVYCSPVARAVQTAELAAAQLGVDVVVREGLQEFGPGDLLGSAAGQGLFEDVMDAWLDGDAERRVPGGETGAEISTRVFAVLDALADLHRGETLLVVTHGGAMCASLAHAGAADLSRGRELRVVPPGGGLRRLAGRRLARGAGMSTTRVFLARHGLADYETDLVTDDGGSLSAEGRSQARGLAELLRSEQVARVWCSPLSRAVQTAEIAAAGLGVDVVVREGLREYGVGSIAGTDADESAVIGPVFGAWEAGDDTATIDGGERIAEIVARVRGVLDEVADQHLGEAALVVSHGGAIMATVPELLGQPRSSAWDLVLPGGGFVVLERDGDSWRLSQDLPPR